MLVFENKSLVFQETHAKVKNFKALALFQVGQ